MNITKEEIIKNYTLIAEYHRKFLEKYKVKLPKLYLKSKFSINALVLAYLSHGYPKQRIVTKTELTNFIKTYYPEVNDVQQARHLAAQSGFYIISGTRNDITQIKINNGEYMLFTLEECYPDYLNTFNKRAIVYDGDYWENLKSDFDNRCATCGSEDGKQHLRYKNTITELQKGHLDPSESLIPGNIIPQCSKCNQADRNKWIYDLKGRVVAVNDPLVIKKSKKEIKLKMYEILKVDLKKWVLIVLLKKSMERNL